MLYIIKKCVKLDESVQISIALVVIAGSSPKDEAEAEAEAEAIPFPARKNKPLLVPLFTVYEPPISVPAFPLAELEEITHNFSLDYLIAKGCEGELIFHGVLKGGQGAVIKQFYKKSQKYEKSFIQQVR